ncbi:RcnB family protein [Sphingomonas sp. DG1-23]|uniref:RcnB family protein n=1 Tax=Sphingomonas sp. DG1-23 TaxID=3068316 RepID=UPI00273F9133|nr:RcnB family protein [Sphingomonas sp. DG1-23]MDP5278652.1 RcnB family protein [Sphingomonas sp. DG1-23]
MKKLILGLVAASIAATPAMAAAPQQYRGHDAPRHHVQRDDHRGYGYQNRGSYQTRSWHRGDRFDSRYARNYRQIDYRQYRGLRAPPRGYRYVQSGNDAVLVAITSGIIGAVFANMIR